VADELVTFPDSVEGCSDVIIVLGQINVTDNVFQPQDFGFTRIDLETRLRAFAYFLGVMTGDMSKHPNYHRRPRTMTVLLQLSKRYESNCRFGNFVTFCAGLLGIPMKRIKDYIRPETAPFDAYRWESKQTRIAMWIFEKCMGLREGENTTNNPIRANWITRTPLDFQTCFLQRFADADGFVSLNKHEIGIVTDPNENLIGTLLTNLSVRFRPAMMKHQSAVLMNVKEGFDVPVFSPYARTHKYELARKLVEAKRYRGPWPKWLRNEVNDLLAHNASPGMIIRTILERHNVAIRSQHIRPKRIEITEVIGGAAGGTLRNVFHVPFESAIGPTLL
jgi:hypothetical protein